MHELSLAGVSQRVLEQTRARSVRARHPLVIGSRSAVRC